MSTNLIASLRQQLPRDWAAQRRLLGFSDA